jgi:outer membrane receptor protein involved in Fe transport
LYAGYNYWRIDASPDAFEAPWTYTTGAYTRRDIWEFSVPYIGYTHDFFRGLKMNVELEYRYYNRDKIISVDARDQPVGKVDHERQVTPVYKAKVDWTPEPTHSLSFGVENRRPKRELADRAQGADGGEYGFNPAKTVKDKATTLFAQDVMAIVPEKLSLTAGLSYNHFDSVTNDSWTPRASLVWLTDRESCLKLTYGEGVREDVLARPIDHPERLRMTEVNYSSAMRFLGAELMNIAAVYHMKYDNMTRTAFMRQPGAAAGAWTGVSIPSLEVYGAEDMLRLSWRRADAFLSVNMNDREEEPTRVGEMNAYVPAYIVKAGVSYRLMEHLLAAVSAVRFGSANSYVESAPYNGTEYVRCDLAPWTKVDVNLRMDRFSLGGMDSALSLRVGNVFDEDGLMRYAVEQARGLLIEPRTVRMELSLAF